MIMLEADRCLAWLRQCFGPSAEFDIEERALRFTEEVLELGQSLGMSREQAEGLVKQVFDKPVGDPKQELGGTMVTLATLCAVTGMNAGSAYSQEFARVDTPAMQAKIRAKHNAKAVVSSNFEGRRRAQAEQQSDSSIFSIER